MIAKVLVWCLKHFRFSEKESVTLTNALIHSVQAVPLHAIITVDENRRILVQGEPLDIEQTISLGQSAVALQQSTLLRLIREQVRFTAIDNGFLRNEKADQYQESFYKAALWYAQQEKELIDALAGPSDPTR